jgi:hypothetical protein
VVSILGETRTCEVVTFNSAVPPGERVMDISQRIKEVLLLSVVERPATRWDVFESYTCRAMTSRLVKVFEKSVSAKESSQELLELPTA